MPRGVPHSEEVRAAVLAALLAGQSITKTAAEYGLNKATVIAWRDAAGLGTSWVEPEKRAEIGGMVADWLASTIRTLRAQADAFDDPKWYKRHAPSEAAVLYGVLADKGIRLLEAQVADEPAPPEDTG